MILSGLALGAGCVGGVPPHDPVPGAQVDPPVVQAPATLGGGLDATTPDATTREISLSDGTAALTVSDDDAEPESSD